MIGIQKWALALTAALSLVHQSVADFTPVHPGTAKDIIMTDKNTLNGTVHENNNITSTTAGSGSSLKFTITNNVASGLNCYVTGKDPGNNNSPAMLQTNGQWYYPTSSGKIGDPQEITAEIAIPMNDEGKTTDITIPGYLISARIWFAVGKLKFFVVLNADNTYSIAQPSETNTSDPSADVNWGFVEFDYEEGSGFYANISYVDFVGLPLGISLTDSSGNVQQALGLPANAVSSICNDLKSQASADGKAWDKLCQATDGAILRALSPSLYMSVAENTDFNGYFDGYVDKVWQKYASTPLIINPQNGNDNVSCTVSDDTLGCPGDDKNYTKPATGDIFGCNGGPFTVADSDSSFHKAAVPRLCAAFNRATLLMDGGNIQPGLDSSHYYNNDVANFYSKIVHKYEVDGKGYAFPYDDVNPEGTENASGQVHSSDPALMSITVGGTS